MNSKLMLLAALIGHGLCWYCGRLLICTPGENSCSRYEEQ